MAEFPESNSPPQENQENPPPSDTPLETPPPLTTPLKKGSLKWVFAALFVLIIFIASAFSLNFFLKQKPQEPSKPETKNSPFSSFLGKDKGVEKFSSEEEFKDYLTEGESSGTSSFFGVSIANGRIRAPAFSDGAPQTVNLRLGGSVANIEGGAPYRISETNVQVAGIDEPDIVKTDGKQIYLSSQLNYYPLPLSRGTRESILPPTYPSSETRLIKAFPPAELSKLSKIDKTGNLLLYQKTLLVFSSDGLYGFDVSNPSIPQEKWKLKLEENNSLVQARLYKDRVYLVARTQVNPERPCPIEPFSLGSAPISIRCSDIYHPVTPIPVDATYTAMTVNPKSGEVQDKVAFVGSSYSSVVYMSPETLYVTYNFEADIFELMYNFFGEEGKDLLSTSIVGKLEELRKYDLSQVAKLTELEWLLGRYQNSLSKDDWLKFENEMENRMESYAERHKRELQKTGIIGIKLDGFSIASSGEVPGSLLNQFSLDEYDSYLRVATTVSGSGFGSLGSFGSGESANDVYVLDQNLKIVGAVKDLGLKERIYSARFIEDRGYLVTFRQIDPFYVLDLSDPKNPKMKGELKIPGYSSYLHPLAKNRILGVGKEGAQVKLSLFDVSSAENPQELDKYTLSEYTTDVLQTQHAFLQDEKHKVFFLPGGQGAYIFSYKDDKLTLARAVSEISAKRAVYLNDYLYVIGDNKLVVLNEADWEKINEVDF